jgi:hypothetical protein
LFGEVKSDGIFVPRSSLITFLTTVILPGGIPYVPFYRLTSWRVPEHPGEYEAIYPDTGDSETL